MPRIDNETFYRAALSKHGDNARGVHWNSADSQRKRFKILSGFLPDELSKISLADAGCGFGDLYLYLQEKNHLPESYIGLEVMEPMVKRARERTDCEIRQCDILHDPLPETDFYLCSGAMNILTRFETHLFIRRCFEASRKGFIFNLLSGKDDSLVYNYFLPKEIKQLGRELGARVKIQEGYLPRDFTVAFFKGKREEGGGKRL
ncbi:MAG: class I SAM-dependent methyltransferase [Campylobacterota bacterium]|nr:class I SAM-dependent methyltransferase [Campylobacterota bacterium]